jgi:hypothetical protein
MADKRQVKRTEPTLGAERAAIGVYPGPEEAYRGRTRTPVVSRVVWGAILAGTLVALVIQLLLSLLGVAIGASTISPTTQQNPFEGLGIGAVIWFGLSLLIALFTGGWVAARLAGLPRTFESVMHGLLTWGLVTLLSFYLLTTALGSLIGGAASLIGTGLSAAGQAATAVAPEAAGVVEDALEDRGINLETIREDAALEEADNEQLRQFVDNLVAGEPVTSQQREEAITALEEGTDMSRTEAEETVDGWIQTSEEAQQTLAEAEATAREVGEDMAEDVSTAALWTFIASLVGAAIAGAGGWLGTPRGLPPLTEV